jgi:hypothetical protein
VSKIGFCQQQKFNGFQHTVPLKGSGRGSNVLRETKQQGMEITWTKCSIFW